MLDFADEDRTRFFRVITDRNDVIERIVDKLRYIFRFVAAYVDAELLSSP